MIAPAGKGEHQHYTPYLHPAIPFGHEYLSKSKVMTNLDSKLKSRDITLSTKVRLVKARFFQWSCMDVRVGPQRKLSTEELMLLNCGAGEDS